MPSNFANNTTRLRAYYFVGRGAKQSHCFRTISEVGVLKHLDVEFLPLQHKLDSTVRLS